MSRNIAGLIPVLSEQERSVVVYLLTQDNINNGIAPVTDPRWVTNYILTDVERVLSQYQKRMDRYTGGIYSVAATWQPYFLSLKDKLEAYANGKEHDEGTTCT